MIKLVSGILGWLLAVELTAAAGAEPGPDDRPVPPAMPRRAIAPGTNAPAGETVALADGEVPFTLFLPQGWRSGSGATATLVVHFHTVPWFIIQEHERRRARAPLVVFQLGEGSTVYRRPFEDTNRLDRVLGIAGRAFEERGAGPVRIQAVDVSSFSAGYGAVRELVRTPRYRGLIRRIVLLDSLYAGWEEAPGRPGRRPAAEHIEPWLAFARAAVRGETTFVLTHSAVPTEKFASSGECAAALLKELQLEAAKVPPGSVPAAADPEFPLEGRADAGNFHVWSYGGTNAQAHLTHVRHLADVWNALDAAK